MQYGKAMVLGSAVCAAGLSVLSSTASAAVIKMEENFDDKSKTYVLTTNADTTFPKQNTDFRTYSGQRGGDIVQSTGYNATKVLYLDGSGGTAASTLSNSATYLGPLTGEVGFSVDFKLTGTSGFTRIYLYDSAGTNNRPLWVNFSHKVTNTATVALDGDTTPDGQGAASASMPSIALGQWYRLSGTVIVDDSAGKDTRFKVTLRSLENTSYNETSAYINSRLSPKDVGRPQLTSEQGAQSYFDNWTVVSVPEPSALGMTSLGGLLLLRRRGQGTEGKTVALAR